MCYASDSMARSHIAAARRHDAWALLGLVCCFCSEPSLNKDSPACKFDGRVTQDLTLHKACSPYVIQGGIDVLDSATLTIEPGVEMRFADGDWLEIAAASTRGGRLIARGTESEPIVLTSIEPETATERSWLGLWFAGGTRDSVVSHMIIRAAGGHNTFLKPTLLQGCLTVTDVADGALALDHVRLEDCNVAGAVLRKSRPKLRDIAVRNAAVGFLLDGLEASPAPDAKFERVSQPTVKRSSTL